MMRPLIQQFVVTCLLISESVMTEASRVYILIWSNEKKIKKYSILASVQFHSMKHMQEEYMTYIFSGKLAEMNTKIDANMRLFEMTVITVA